MRRALGALLSTLTAIALVFAGVCVLMFLAQRALLYYPVGGGPPAGAERLEVRSGDATVRVWARGVPGAGALIYFGGNAEDVGMNFAPFATALPGRALYLVNYRGYGGSSGSPSERALFDDALAVYDQVQARHPAVAVAGRSLGSGVAVHLASRRPVSRLVLVTPFDSIENVAAGIYPFLPVRLLLLDKFDSASRVAAVRAPTLVVIAERDEVIPRARTDALVAKFPAEQVRVEVVRGATHNALDYEDLLAAFLEK
ncbi:MAG: alpha/beta hydrolase [Nevskiaceae bacterium]